MASEMRSPIRRPSIDSMSRTIAFRFTTRACSICLRLNASSCRVSAAAWLPAFSISSTDISASREGSPSGDSRSSAAWPLMMVSRLLKSWAMPPASLPMASIFCDCRRSASVRASSRSALRRRTTFQVKAPMTIVCAKMKSVAIQISGRFSR